MNILKLFGNIGSPNQLKETLLSKLPPEQREMIKGMMASGKDPREALMESAKSGKINLQELNQARGMFKTMKMFGIRNIQIPAETWDEAEKIIRSSARNTKF